MTDNSTKSPALGSEAKTAVDLLDDWFGPIEAGLRDRVRDLIRNRPVSAALREGSRWAGKQWCK
jgi:hypothetical protein